MEKHYQKMIQDTQDRVVKSLQIQILDKESQIWRVCGSYGNRSGEVRDLPHSQHDGGLLQ